MGECVSTLGISGRCQCYGIILKSPKRHRIAEGAVLEGSALSGVSNGMFHLIIFCLGRTEGLTVIAGLVETANLLLAGCKHFAGITNSLFARLELLG